MDDLTMPAAEDFVIPPPPPGFVSWAESSVRDSLAAHRAGTPTAYVEYSTGADGPYITYHYVAQKDS